MELPVLLQAGEFAQALAWGAALALQYDLLRALRRRVGLAALWDGLFCLAVLLALWLFLLGPGRGLLRLAALAGMALGAGAWFGTLSRPALRLFCYILEFLGRTRRFVLRPAKKTAHFLGKIAKRGFHFFSKHATMSLSRFPKGSRKSEGSSCGCGNRPSSPS